jgi:hypothetical protein
VINIEKPLKATTRSAKRKRQGIAMEFGKGRVVIWGEAAMLTIQNGDDGMNYSGTDNKQLVLNIAHWLTRLL